MSKEQRGRHDETVANQEHDQFQRLYDWTHDKAGRPRSRVEMREKREMLEPRAAAPQISSASSSNVITVGDEEIDAARINNLSSDDERITQYYRKLAESIDVPWTDDAMAQYDALQSTKLVLVKDRPPEPWKIVWLKHYKYKLFTAMSEAANTILPTLCYHLIARLYQLTLMIANKWKEGQMVNLNVAGMREAITQNAMTHHPHLDLWYCLATYQTENCPRELMRDHPMPWKLLRTDKPNVAMHNILSPISKRKKKDEDVSDQTEKRAKKRST